MSGESANWTKPSLAEARHILHGALWQRRTRTAAWNLGVVTAVFASLHGIKGQVVLPLYVVLVLVVAFFFVGKRSDRDAFPKDARIHLRSISNNNDRWALFWSVVFPSFALYALLIWRLWMFPLALLVCFVVAFLGEMGREFMVLERGLFLSRVRETQWQRATDRLLPWEQIEDVALVRIVPQDLSAIERTHKEGSLMPLEGDWLSITTVDGVRHAWPAHEIEPWEEFMAQMKAHTLVVRRLWIETDQSLLPIDIEGVSISTQVRHKLQVIRTRRDWSGHGVLVFSAALIASFLFSLHSLRRHFFTTAYTWTLISWAMLAGLVLSFLCYVLLSRRERALFAGQS